MTSEATHDPAGYLALLEQVKDRVRSARVRVALAANRELIGLYWSIGREIIARQAEVGWGGKVVERLSADLRREFPELKGFSARNLRYMKAFAEAWPDLEILQQPAAELSSALAYAASRSSGAESLPWFHHCLLLDRTSSASERAFYVHEAVAHGWTRAVLKLHLDRRLHERQGQAVTNFEATLAHRTELATQVLKDPYVFDFLGLGDDAQERDIEQAMVRQVRDTLVELGAGFAFVGQQVSLEVGDQEFFVDLLFYHVRLHCYVVVELKAGEFKPEHAGQLNFYCSAADDLIRDKAADGPTIGLLLCRTRNRIVAEYALRDIQKPIGVAQIELTRLLPEPLRTSLPTIETLEAELSALGREPGATNEIEGTSESSED